MPRKALIIGGTGQLGRAAAERLAGDGWEVDLGHRGPAVDTGLEGVRSLTLDRNDTPSLLAAARGRELVIDTVAFVPQHGRQLAQLAGEIGSLVVVSSGAVYAGPDGQSSETGHEDEHYPDYPVPITEDWPTLPDGGSDYGSLKAALERVLLETDGLPVSILRPGTLHGPYSTSLHHWSFIKRVLDGRRFAVLAYDGESRFSTSAAANVARLMQLCAEQPRKRVLNAADDQALTVAEIGRKIFEAMGRELAIVTFPGAPKPGRVGFNPWGIPKPTVLGMEKARRELGYDEAISYDDAIQLDIDWAVDAVAAAEKAGGSWADVFPGVIARYGANGWFPYAEEDTYLCSLTASRPENS